MSLKLICPECGYSDEQRAELSQLQDANKEFLPGGGRQGERAPTGLRQALDVLSTQETQVWRTCRRYPHEEQTAAAVETARLLAEAEAQEAQVEAEAAQAQLAALAAEAAAMVPTSTPPVQPDVPNLVFVEGRLMQLLSGGAHAEVSDEELLALGVDRNAAEEDEADLAAARAAKAEGGETVAWETLKEELGLGGSEGETTEPPDAPVVTETAANGNNGATAETDPPKKVRAPRKAKETVHPAGG